MAVIDPPRRWFAASGVAGTPAEGGEEEFADTELDRGANMAETDIRLCGGVGEELD